MVNTIDMKDMRYLNLFERITRVQTKYCFEYNNTLIFAVPRNLISKALGQDVSNLRRLNEILKRRIKVVAIPDGDKDIKHFIETVVSPVSFKEVEVTENEIILNAGPQSKAALIGRNKRRFLEMKGIVKDFFNRDFRII